MILIDEMSRLRSSTSVTHAGGTLYARASIALLSSSLRALSRFFVCRPSTSMPDAPRSGVFLWVFNESRYLQKSAVLLLVAITAPRGAAGERGARGGKEPAQLAPELTDSSPERALQTARRSSHQLRGVFKQVSEIRALSSPERIAELNAHHISGAEQARKNIEAQKEAFAKLPVQLQEQFVARAKHLEETRRAERWRNS